MRNCSRVSELHHDALEHVPDDDTARPVPIVGKRQRQRELTESVAKTLGVSKRQGRRVIAAQKKKPPVRVTFSGGSGMKSNSLLSIRGEIDTTYHTQQRSMFASGLAAEIGVHAFAVWHAIKSHADFQTGVAWPGIRRLCELTGASDKTVQAAIKTLVAAHLLRVTKRGQNPMSHASEWTFESVIVLFVRSSLISCPRRCATS